MTTEIRLLFRSGPATTIKFDGSFDKFCKELVSRSVQSKDLAVPVPLAEFPTFAVNLEELACASVYAVHADPEPADPKNKDAK